MADTLRARTYPCKDRKEGECYGSLHVVLAPAAGGIVMSGYVRSTPGIGQVAKTYEPEKGP